MGDGQEGDGAGNAMRDLSSRPSAHQRAKHRTAASILAGSSSSTTPHTTRRTPTPTPPPTPTLARHELPRSRPVRPRICLSLAARPG